MKCCKCARVLPNDSEFCQFCGAKIKQNVEYVIHSDAKINKVSKKTYCRACGSEIDNKSRKCTGCGKQYIKMIHVVLLALGLLVVFVSLLFAFKMGESKGYQDGLDVDSNTSTMSKAEYEAYKKQNETQTANANSSESGNYSSESSYSSYDVSSKRKCIAALCENEVDGTNFYCFEHQCYWPDCSLGRNRGGYYCSTHTCNDVGCDNPVIANYKSYCTSHTCYYPGCTSGQAINSLYCLMHN